MLSVAIITWNEEENIQAALESVKWADEIIVLDSLSEDRTQEICRQYTNKVFSAEWPGFAKQKNKAVSMTTHRWVLVLDADERVTRELQDEILTVINDENARDGYFVPRKNYYAKRWIRYGGWWPDYTLRLFKKGKGSFGDREVHESVVVNGTVGYLKHPLEHFTYKDSKDYHNRMQIYSTLSAKELFKKGQRANILDVVLRPIATFLKMFVLRLGVMDGMYGIKIAYLYSLYTYEKYLKLRRMEKVKNPT